MEILTKSELKIRADEIKERVLNGEVFIHPTDTIYGLGCNAFIKDSVDKIRELKGRPDAPFSIWVPSKKMISKICKISEDSKAWIEKLPGPYTLILPLKEKGEIADNVNPKDNTIGIRYPDHWFGEFIQFMGIPIVTTSANRVGKEFMISVDNLDPEIKKGVSFMIYEGEKKGRPSKIVHLEEGAAKIRER